LGFGKDLGKDATRATARAWRSWAASTSSDRAASRSLDAVEERLGALTSQRAPNSPAAIPAALRR